MVPSGLENRRSARLPGVRWIPRSHRVCVHPYIVFASVDVTDSTSPAGMTLTSRTEFFFNAQMHFEPTGTEPGGAPLGESRWFIDLAHAENPGMKLPRVLLLTRWHVQLHAMETFVHGSQFAASPPAGAMIRLSRPRPCAGTIVKDSEMLRCRRCLRWLAPRLRLGSYFVCRFPND